MCVCVCVCVCVCCGWDSLEQVWVIDCAAGGFVMCVCECVFVCAGCGTVWRRFEGVRVQHVALWCVGKCVCVLRV